MEPLAQPVDQPPDNLGKPRRSSRWWRKVTFFVLAILVVFAVLVFGVGGSPRYHFLNGARLVWSEEYIYKGIFIGDEWNRIVRYRSNQTVERLAKKLRSELPKSDWSEQSESRQDALFLNESTGQSVLIATDPHGTFVDVGQARPPTLLDRARVWAINLGHFKPQQRIIQPITLP